MQVFNSKDGQKYDVAVVKLIRNNNIVINRNEMLSDSTYFMLDYFDLLYYTKLIGKDKIYRKFWNFNDNYTKEDLNYKVAYKTLSLFAESSENSSDIFEIVGNQTTLSVAPFLGIIQINYVYNYQEESDLEKTLLYCEQEIVNCLCDNGFNESDRLRYKIYRSSTSGDFCLVVKSAMIRDVFKMAILINGMTIKQDNRNYKFNTYTNIGIECPVGEDDTFLGFQDETIRNNKKCRFALRFTTNNKFAKCIYAKVENKETFESVAGLFGRYDYLLRLSMEEFAEIYGVLCESKVVGCKGEESDLKYDENVTLIELLRMGIKSKRIKIINERALVPLEESTFNIKAADIRKRESERLDSAEINGEPQAEETRQLFGEDLEKFHEMKSLFFEESRTFTDINRALGEMISTYVPQGIDNDSYVNWRILISDLRVIFKCAFEWEKSYEKLNDAFARKQERTHFLQDMRLVIDAVNQYYKFLQNVNIHTWQSPLYEIQTQLDAEKMMIAYREFLYDYFKNYRKCNKTEDDEKRPMFYPIVYPDLSIDQACAMVVFQEERTVGNRILICRVPSFEYYGRMFNMVPWILHEASHSVRMISRYDRNKYLFKLIMGKVFLQAVYKLLNQATNDIGYFKLGNLEKDIVNRIVEALESEFVKCRYEDGSDRDIFHLEFNRFETEMIRFLNCLFSRNIYYMEGKTTTDNIKSIQAKVLSFLGELNLLGEEIIVEKKVQSAAEAVLACGESMEALCKLLERIYNKYYENLMGAKPHETEWRMLLQDVDNLEESLKVKVGDSKIQDEKRREYLFKIREMSRLYWAWRRTEDEKRSEEIKKAIWMECVLDIRERIEKGFADCEGFVELYRILHVIFGFEDGIDEEQSKRISKEFDILFQEEARMLAEEEITIYRETCADLYMAAALGLSSFGYCRQICQTVSGVGIENEEGEMNFANISRLRVVAAIILGEECNVKPDEKARYVKVPMESLWSRGKEYCKKTFECAKNGILQDIQPENKQMKADIEYIYQCLSRNIDEMFDDCTHNDFYKEKLDDSVLGIYLNLEIADDLVADEGKEEYEKLKRAFKNVKKELNTRLYVIYRIKYFIAALSLISTEGNIVIDTEEYAYFREVYEKQKKACSDIREGSTCKVVSAYYNDPDSAVSKNHESMLEDTLDFIQRYYYKNRFKVMSSINCERNQGN